MPAGWNLTGVKKATALIAHDTLASNKKFNVAAILDGDTRAYPYRYLLETNGIKPESPEAYPEAEVLYVIGRGEETDILFYPVWEIYAFQPLKIDQVWSIQNGIKLFKLIK